MKELTPKRFWAVASFGIVAVVGIVWFFGSLLQGLPSLEELENPKPPFATRVYSIDGELIDKFYEENRSRITSIDSIPTPFIEALLATEDMRFFDHWGVDLRSIVRAVLSSLTRLSLSGGGASTITQQLARKLYLTNEVSLTRKLREWITAVQIERRYTKNEIFVMYCNVAPFGRGTYGLQSAAQEFFSKTPQQLTTAECAMLVGLLKNPTGFDPRRNYTRAFNRRNTVLGRLADEGFISEEQFQKFRSDSIVTKTRSRSAGIAPSFVEYIRQMLREKAEKYGFNLYRDGLTVYTTLDSRMQEHANRACAEHLQTFQPAFLGHWNWETPKNRAILASAIKIATRATPQYQAAKYADQKELVMIRCRNNQRFVDSVKRAIARIQVGFCAIDPHTGQIRAMVGNSDFQFRYGLNHVTQIQRQPGSAFKPFVYTVAIDNGYSPAYQLPNEPISISDGSGKKWSPKNFGGETGGIYTLRRGLMNSVNIIAVRTILEIAPPDEVVRYAKRMGIESDLHPFPSLALGSMEVVPLDIIGSYGAFANEGLYAKPFGILRIIDRDGRVIETRASEVREVLSRETAYIMTSMLRSVVTGGTGSSTRRYFTGPAGGKTGTTQDYADAWFIGFTPNMVAGVWTGFDDRRITFSGSFGQGSMAAAPIWGRFMKAVYEDKRINLPKADFIMPEGVVQEKICLDTQNLAGPYCQNTVVEYINKKYMPGMCTLHTFSSSGVKK